MLTLLRLSAAQSTKMDCGPRVNACGVLTLESGLGPGVYGHTEPSVHGLWPEVGSYGTSACIAPSVSTASPTRVYSCYEYVAALAPDSFALLAPTRAANLSTPPSPPPSSLRAPPLPASFAAVASVGRPRQGSLRLKRTSGGSMACARAPRTQTTTSVRSATSRWLQQP